MQELWLLTYTFKMLYLHFRNHCYIFYMQRNFHVFGILELFTVFHCTNTHTQMHVKIH